MSQHELIATDHQPNQKPSPFIEVGLSACLAGQNVRYNGGHTQSRLCLDILSEHFSFKTFCPEVAAGFSTPRATMRLTGNPQSPQLVFSNDATEDLTQKLFNGFEEKLLTFSELDGYILMKNSPSCGLERIKVYQANGQVHKTRTTGLFTQALMTAYPYMPIEEEGRIHDPKIFDNFIARVYAYHNFRTEVLKAPSLHKLINFHSRYKYLLMAHDQTQYRQLGQLLAGQKNLNLKQLMDRYLAGFMEALSKPASKKNHTNTLLHILGYLKNSVPSKARAHILQTIDKYQKGIFPLATPLTLLKHYLDQYGSDYIKSQHYLDPYPDTINPLRKYYI